MKNLILTLIITLPLTLWGQKLKISGSYVIYSPNQSSLISEDLLIGHFGFGGCVSHESKIKSLTLNHNFSFYTMKQKNLITDFTQDSYLFEFGISPKFQLSKIYSILPGLNFLLHSINIFEETYLSISINNEFKLSDSFFSSLKIDLPIKTCCASDSASQSHPSLFPFFNIGIGYCIIK